MLARNSAQNFHETAPEPSGSPCQLPRTIGPAGMKIAGRFMLIAGISRGKPPACHTPRFTSSTRNLKCA
jgi:hypothetical protein